MDVRIDRFKAEDYHAGIGDQNSVSPVRNERVVRVGLGITPIDISGLKIEANRVVLVLDPRCNHYIKSPPLYVPVEEFLSDYRDFLLQGYLPLPASL